MGLYQYPAVYAALLRPEADLVADVGGWVSEYANERVKRVCDPACGPGDWLLEFGRLGAAVAGNDLEPLMVEAARQRLSQYRAEVVVGDMRELSFVSGPFDLALNLHASVGHLENDAEVLRHLRSMADHLAPRGLYFLGLTICDAVEIRTEPEILYQTSPMPIPGGGSAAVMYQSLSRDPFTRREVIDIVALTKGVLGCPPIIQERYELLTFPAAVILDLVDAAGFDLLAAPRMTEEGRPKEPLAKDAGDVTLILERRRPRSSGA